MSDQLNPCGCCETPDLTPTVFNRPGLPALSYRVATQQTALARMLAALTEASQGNGLQLLTTRDLDDPAIAMLDAFAIVADVLSFYDERIANEGYLATATERLSVLQLARAVGYELTPGVAASTYLSFSADSRSVSAAAETPSSAAIVDVPAGTPVQSIPAQGQKPQTFETGADLQAVAEFNELSLLLTVPGTLDPAATELVLQGTTTRLQAGDVLLLASADSRRQHQRRAHGRARDERHRGCDQPADDGRRDGLLARRRRSRASRDHADDRGARRVHGDHVQRQRPQLPQRRLHLLGRLLQRLQGGRDPRAEGSGARVGWTSSSARSSRRRPTLPAEAGVFALRQHAAVFGANAPAWNSNLSSTWGNDWDSADATPVTILTNSFGTARGSSSDEIVYLDNSYPAVVPGSWVTFIDPAVGVRSVVIDSVDALSAADYAISGKTTALHLADPPAWNASPDGPAVGLHAARDGRLRAERASRPRPAAEPQRDHVDDDHAGPGDLDDRAPGTADRGQRRARGRAGDHRERGRDGRRGDARPRRRRHDPDARPTAAVLLRREHGHDQRQRRRSDARPDGLRRGGGKLGRQRQPELHAQSAAADLHAGGGGGRGAEHACAPGQRRRLVPGPDPLPARPTRPRLRRADRRRRQHAHHLRGRGPRRAAARRDREHHRHVPKRDRLAGTCSTRAS